MIFSPIKIGTLTLKNRIVMPAIHLGFSSQGEINDKIMDFYQERAQGGVGAIVVGGCAVERRGSLPHMISIDHDDCIPGLTGLVSTISDQDCKVFIQLFHGGRNTTARYTGAQPIAPSPIPSPIYKETPQEMARVEILETIDLFAKAALRAKKAGAHGVEISASAGYLISQFLSPLTNKRDDDFGGSLENRMKFARRIVQSIKAITGPDFPVILRVSGADLLEGGCDLASVQQVCQTLAKEGLDGIHVTGGWHESPVPQVTYHVPPGNYGFLAKAIKDVVDIPVIAANRINDYPVAQKLLADNFADLVAIGRGLIADPQLPNRIKNKKHFRKCVACNQGCIEMIFKAQPVKCMVNPEVGHGKTKVKATKKKILVVGGGPAGMEAARACRVAGHEVQLYHKDSQLGGKLSIASVPPFKEGLQSIGDFYSIELLELGVEVHLNTEATEEIINEQEPDLVVLATGSVPIVPNIPGLFESQWLLAEDVLTGGATVPGGSVAIIGGGLVGLETAHYLALVKYLNQENKSFFERFLPVGLDKALADIRKITIIEESKRVGKDMGSSTRWILLQELKALGVEIVTEHKAIKIEKDGIRAQNNQGEESLIPARGLVLAVGSKPSDSQSLASYLKEQGISYKVLGDGLRPGNIMEAIAGGYALAQEL